VYGGDAKKRGDIAETWRFWASTLCSGDYGDTGRDDAF